MNESARKALHRRTWAPQRAPPTHAATYAEAVAAAEAVEGSLPTWSRGASGMQLNLTLHMQVSQQCNDQQGMSLGNYSFLCCCI